MFGPYKIAGVVLITIGSIASIGFSQHRIDTLHESALEGELLYIPSEKLLTHFTAGMSNVIADLLWIETIQYTVKEFKEQERKFEWLEHMCHAVADLDPHFIGAYTNGATFLSSIGADDEALKLLKLGFRRNPRSWEIPHEIVKIYVLNRRDRPESPAVTTHYLRMMAERHEHPEMYLMWARRIQEQNDLTHEAREIWEDVLANSKDKFIRELASANLRILVIGENVDTLNKLAERFETAMGRRPRDIQELVDVGMLETVPVQDADSGRYFLDETGEVQNTVLLEDVKNRMLIAINARGRLTAKDRGRNAVDLDEWLEWIGEDLPEHPLPGGTWKYAAAKGELY